MSKISRLADFVFGVPILAFGASLISLDAATLIMQLEGHHVMMWVVPAGTMWGILPFLFGCRLILRRRNPVKPPNP